MEEDQTVIKGALMMPAKQMDESRLKQVGSIPVLMNGYELDLSKVPDKVYKHELKLIAIRKGNKEKDLTRGPKNDVAVTLRRRVLWSIYTCMLKSNSDFFGGDTKVFFFDCGINFYSTNKLLDRSEGEKQFHLKPEQLSSNSRDFLGPKVMEVVAKLLACGEVFLKGSAAVDECITERERSLQQFLEVALNQKMFHNQEHFIFGNKAYNRPSSHDRPLNDGKVLQSGFEKNVRFVGDFPESAISVVQIDAKKSAFFKEQNLVALVAALCHSRLELIMNDAKTRQKVARQLKDLVVRTNHLPKCQRDFCIFGITKETTEKVIVMVDNQEVSVAEYFYHKYGIGLRHSYLPCVIERRVSVGSKQPMNSYFPMECLDVVKGQRVELKKQTPDLVEELINSCRLLPAKLQEENEKQRRSAYITSENPYLHKLGLRVSETPRGANATILFPPAIIYGEGARVEPNASGDLDWRLNVPRSMMQRQFYRPANAPRRWVVFLFEDAVDRASLDRFLYAYVERAQSHGIKLQRPSRVESVDRVDMDFLLDKMKIMRKNGVEYVLFITKEKRDPVHDLVVRTNHLPKCQRDFCIFGITKETTEKVIVMVDNQEVSVAEYFYHKYGIGLRHSYLPCVIERRVSVGSKQPMNSYFPMECLDVVKGQRVELKKQTPDLVEELINSCRLLPAKLQEENEKQRRSAYITSENPYLHKLGLRVSETPRGANATILFPPAIIYGEGARVEPNASGDLDWRLNVPRSMMQRQFYRPANAPRRWVVFLFEDAVDRASLDRFLYAYVERAQSHGIKLQRPSRVESVDRVDMDFLLDKMKIMRKNGVEYVLFITKEKRDPVHDTLKFSEVVAMVVTQHVHSKTMLKAISNRGAEMTLDNIVMKMNLKLGGISHALASSGRFLRANQLAANIMEKTWLRASRMFIGIDMSHSSPQSLYERQAGIPPSEPTVVGMAYTCGGPFAMRGEYWMQEPRVSAVQYLRDHVMNALNYFKEESSGKSFPEHVVVYRSGVSEGEYAKVMSAEADAFREAFDAVLEGSKGKIRLSIICVQVNSNYRLFPENGTAMGNAMQQNVPAGTCVDTSIVHPSQTEFILVAHKSIMGTARPIRCTVLVDDAPRMSLDEVEGITNALCYAHGIVTSPVSLPAHLYAASNLAKRGRNNWKTANCAGDDASMSSDGCERGQFRNDGTPEFFPTMSGELAPKLRHKFWA
ncbi:Uncharacterized protein C16C10.3 [Toxocara canis]|uniref:Uncharacterized protein C16C10.3 n=1 Tax=Toxocara canis TaxID=6265 RepID=A0A0B2VKW3_TOXCA|nr:Uncharacterized protein C16C10.3 [Toxocara canis]